jgi:hypothetical protein
VYNTGRLFSSKSGVSAYYHTDVRTLFIPLPEEFSFRFLFKALYNILNKGVLTFRLVAILMITTFG